MDPAVLLPPPAPYPRRRSGISLMDPHSNGPSKKEGTTSVVGGIRGRTYYFRRCKKVQASNIEFLSDEVLIEILMRLSADEIFEKARFVCRNWYHLIHSDAFINAHRHHHRDNWGLLLTCLCCIEQPLFLGARQGRIELSEAYSQTYSAFTASCNGLLLSMDFGRAYTIGFVNLATKQAFSCPPSRPRGRIFYFTFGMAYAAASMEYKVVRAYIPNADQPTICHILTAGVDDNWRSVGVDNLSCEAKKLLILQHPLSTQGFLHWTWKWEGTRVLTLNAETEMFTESYVPLLPHPVDDEDARSAYYKRNRRCKFFLSTGRRLSLLLVCGEWAWQVWEMEGESGEWIKLLPNIDLGAHKQTVKQGFASPSESRCHGFLEPLGWVKYPVLLALHFGTTCIVYNLDTNEIDYTTQLPHAGRYYRALVHRNTLEWLS